MAESSYKKYGHFTDDNLEFVVTRPDTPAPWVNYISNGNYTRLISNSGGGFAFYKTPRLHRITRHRYNSMPFDRPGHYLYVRDAKTGDYWSPSWQPCARDLDSYECHHGMNYTRFVSARNGVKVDALFFVAPDADAEIWRCCVKNESKKAVTLDLFSYVELCLGNALNDLVNQPNDQHFNDVFFDKKAKTLFASKRYWNTFGDATVEQSNREYDRFYFMTSSLPISHFEGNKARFSGKWRSETNPIMVEKGKLEDTEITSGDAVLALQMPLTLKPGESKNFVILLGVVAKRDAKGNFIYKAESARVAKKYLVLANVDKAFRAMCADWKDYLSCVQVKTPDADFDTMMNVWNQYQTSCTFRFSRDASYYHGGLLFKRGYRDSCQDTFGPLMSRPEQVRDRLIELASLQLPNGRVVHCYDRFDGNYTLSGHCDTPLWLPMATAMYIRETGDYSILDVKVPYLDASKAPKITPTKAVATVFKHLCMCLDFTIGNLSPRKLCKFNNGDWNDTLDYMGRNGRGESVWNTMALCYALKEIIGLCKRVKNSSMQSRYTKSYNEISAAINKYCWDGEWYVCGTNDLRKTIGSKKNAECKIYLNSQTWAVMSGVASEERAKKSLDCAYKMCNTPKGPQMLYPAWRTIDPNIGLATRCVHGKKENGSIFNHPVSWAVLAEAMLGHGDRAFEYYKESLPLNDTVSIDRYELEPYVYSEYVTSPEHETFGQASHAWLTGSSTWMLRDGVDYILGVRPDYDGLIIDPCIPAAWKSFKISRKFRGKKYEITVKNPDGVCKGVKSMIVDGKPVEGNLIVAGKSASPKAGAKLPVVKVEVTMGCCCGCARHSKPAKKK
ncbi:MAG: hypothetical protein PHX74_08970 [Candidatus Sumerlaeales bacterium]|nr:hypothetical protein [Candidatus Sumerlaeales bacterium]